MHDLSEHDTYLAAVREELCRRCVQQLPNPPLCQLEGKSCCIELRLPEIVEICHSTNCCLFGPYLDRFDNEICVDCEFRRDEQRGCQWQTLLPLAVEAVEAVDRRGVDRDR